MADLIGCEVRDADTGKVYGVVTSVDHPGAQDIYTVKAPGGKEYMFPGVDAFLKERNPPEGYILVTPIPGLLDDDCDSEMCIRDRPDTVPPSGRGGRFRPVSTWAAR